MTVHTISISGGIIQSVRTTLPDSVAVSLEVFDWDDRLDESGADVAVVAKAFEALCATTREL